MFWAPGTGSMESGFSVDPGGGDIVSHTACIPHMRGWDFTRLRGPVLSRLWPSARSWGPLSYRDRILQV